LSSNLHLVKSDCASDPTMTMAYSLPCGSAVMTICSEKVEYWRVLDDIWLLFTFKDDGLKWCLCVQCKYTNCSLSGDKKGIVFKKCKKNHSVFSPRYTLPWHSWYLRTVVNVILTCHKLTAEQNVFDAAVYDKTHENTFSPISWWIAE